MAGVEYTCGGRDIKGEPVKLLCHKPPFVPKTPQEETPQEETRAFQRSLRDLLRVCPASVAFFILGAGAMVLAGCGIFPAAGVTGSDFSPQPDSGDAGSTHPTLGASHPDSLPTLAPLPSGTPLPSSSPTIVSPDKPSSPGGCTFHPEVNLNVRTGPSTAFGVVRVLKPGESVPAVGSGSDKWVAVRGPNGEVLWVHGGYGSVTCPPGAELKPITPDPKIAKTSTPTRAPVFTRTPTAALPVSPDKLGGLNLVTITIPDKGITWRAFELTNGSSLILGPGEMRYVILGSQQPGRAKATMTIEVAIDKGNPRDLHLELWSIPDNGNAAIVYFRGEGSKPPTTAALDSNSYTPEKFSYRPLALNTTGGLIGVMQNRGGVPFALKFRVENVAPACSPDGERYWHIDHHLPGEEDSLQIRCDYGTPFSEATPPPGWGWP